MAVADGAHHFDIEHGALHDALGFDKFSLLLQFFLPPPELVLDTYDGAVALFLGHDVMRFRVDGNTREVFVARADFTGERIDLAESVDLVAPHFNAVALIFVGGIDFDHVAANPEGAATKVLAAFVLNVHETPEERFALDLADIAEVWRRGSVISSWLLDLTASALAQDPKLEGYSGYVEDSGEGRWTIMAAIEQAVSADVLAAALFARFRSRQDHTFAEKILSAMRKGFGGHQEPK